MIEYNSQEKQDSLSHVRFADEELIKTQVLQGEAAQTIIQGKNCSVYKMENETGEGVITRYPVFPGIELLYDDIHMSCGVAHREDPRADLLEINHCRLGRFECEFSDGSAVYLGEGDLAVNVMTNRTRETWFPLSHYHGITIAVDIPVADRVLRQVSEALGEGCTVTSLLCGTVCVPVTPASSCGPLSPSSTSSPSFTTRRRICGQVISNSR